LRKVILSLGLVVGIIAWAVGIYGLVTTPNPHLIPIPDRVTTFGVVAMMGTLLLLVIVFAHGTRAGDMD
jgi:hypothetical protein